MVKVFVGARVVVALAVAAAIVVQLRSSIDFASKDGEPETGSVLINFFSYFTIDSNALSVVMLLLGAASLVRGGQDAPGFALFRASVTTYMVITGLVYNTLLRGLLTQGAVVPWSNEVLHVIAPAYLLVDWLLAPGRRPMPTRHALVVVAFPIVWAVYTLVRGPFANDPFLQTDYWYPYPFLNPETSDGGYASVAVYVVVLSVAFIVVAAAVLWVSRRFDRSGSTA